MDLSINIDHIMTTDLVTVPFDASFAEVEALFRSRNIHHLLVEDDYDQLIGILSNEDLKRVVYFVSDPSKLQAQHMMTVEPIVLKEDSTMAEALDILLDNRIRALPVVDQAGIAIGIVTPYDFLSFLEEKSRPDIFSPREMS